jgi:hypothetical protein
MPGVSFTSRFVRSGIRRIFLRFSPGIMGDGMRDVGCRIPGHNAEKPLACLPSEGRFPP